MKKALISLIAGRSVIWVSFAVMFLLGFLKILIGRELSLFVFYFIPVALMAWHYGIAAGIITALCSAFVWMTADHLSGQAYSSQWFLLWNTGIRLAAFVSISFTMAEINSLLKKQRKISEGLSEALQQVKQLKGLIPICSGCKKIRNDSGYWQQLEEYLVQHSEATFSHGLCRDCADKMLREAGLEPLEKQIEAGWPRKTTGK